MLYWLRLRNRFYLLAVLPGLFWSGPQEPVSALRKAGVPIAPFSTEAQHSRIQLTPPGIDRKVMVASATTAPWVNANGWNFRRNAGREFWCDVPSGAAKLAAAEAYAYQAKVMLKIAPSDLDPFQEIIKFVQTLPDRTLPDIADFGFVDDGSDRAGEILNLLTRRNLLYKVLRAPDPQFRLNVTADSDDPYLFAAKVREKLTDNGRSLRIYGSEVVLCRLTGNASQIRLHLLNYGRNRVDGLRVRLRGSFKNAKLYGITGPKDLQDWASADGFTEFSIPELGTYAVVDLTR